MSLMQTTDDIAMIIGHVCTVSSDGKQACDHVNDTWAAIQYMSSCQISSKTNGWPVGLRVLTGEACPTVWVPPALFPERVTPQEILPEIVCCAFVPTCGDVEEEMTSLGYFINVLLESCDSDVRAICG